jgi:hypothetical protein
MYFNFNRKDKRMESNVAELKPVMHKNYIVVGTDDKGKSYTTTIHKATFLEAKKDAKWWAKSHNLNLDSVQAL